MQARSIFAPVAAFIASQSTANTAVVPCFCGDVFGKAKNGQPKLKRTGREIIVAASRNGETVQFAATAA
jgi:hypothetical protein